MAGPATRTDRPPAQLVTGEAVHGNRLDTVFARFNVERLSCKFREEKHIALLARPLLSTGVIYFDRSKGVARRTLAPKAGEVVVTKTMLRIVDGARSETIPLAKSKELKAFALIFPTLLRGDRTELERSFDIGLYGTDRAWWALVFTPRDAALKAIVQRVVVYGRASNVVLLQVNEANGDRTDTELSDIVRNGDVPDAAIATAFGDS